MTNEADKRNCWWTLAVNEYFWILETKLCQFFLCRSGGPAGVVQEQKDTLQVWSQETGVKEVTSVMVRS